jgi:DNA-directed RNA polymerase subunit E'/Rpb7
MSSPYTNRFLHASVELRADQLDNDIYLHLLANLREQVENVCTKYGIVTHVYKISEYGDGYISAEDLRAIPRYRITYACKLCRPIEKTQIVCKLTHATKSLMLGTNGPIVVIINKMNTELFDMEGEGGIYYEITGDDGVKSRKELQKSDLLKVTIEKVLLSEDADQIKVLAYPEAVVTDKDEIQAFFRDQFADDADHFDVTK